MFFHIDTVRVGSINVYSRLHLQVLFEQCDLVRLYHNRMPNGVLQEFHLPSYRGPA